jgi:small redox-active disulfide protein 2
MAIFGIGKKKEKKTEGCSCGGSCCGGTEAVKSPVKVLGSGCAKCNALEQNVKEALQELGMDTAIEHVTDFEQIASMGVLVTPALVVDGKVLSSGKVLNKNEARKLIESARNR